MKKRTLRDFRKESNKRKVLCPRCMKSNKFELRITDSGYMVFICKCGMPTLMPFKEIKDKKLTTSKGEK